MENYKQLNLWLLKMRRPQQKKNKEKKKNGECVRREKERIKWRRWNNYGALFIADESWRNGNIEWVGCCC